MENILFVIDSLNCGGAEKSLLSLLNNIDYSRYKIDILLFKRGGELEKFLSPKVNILNSPEYFRYIGGYINNISKMEKLKFKAYRMKTSINLRLNNISQKTKHSEQVVYGSINRILKAGEKKYDVAIAYSQGFPTYFVSEKVKARKKLAWINCDYVKTKYDKEIDNEFYANIDSIITVSKFAYDSISNMKYGYKEKLKIVLDIVDPTLIKNLSLKEDAVELKTDEFNILTVGRLATVKGYDLAVNTAKLLKKSGYSFKWYVIGEGPERYEIEKDIKEKKLENEFILLGTQTNPYPYMRACNLYVQTSRKEGFGLAVMEAKILKSLIITTDFDTATELIENNKDGYIVSKNEVDIYNAIVNVMTNERDYKRILDNLENSELYSSISEINKIYEIIS